MVFTGINIVYEVKYLIILIHCIMSRVLGLSFVVVFTGINLFGSNISWTTDECKI